MFLHHKTFDTRERLARGKALEKCRPTIITCHLFIMFIVRGKAHVSGRPPCVFSMCSGSSPPPVSGLLDAVVLANC